MSNERQGLVGFHFQQLVQRQFQALSDFTYVKCRASFTGITKGKDIGDLKTGILRQFLRPEERRVAIRTPGVCGIPCQSVDEDDQFLSVGVLEKRWVAGQGDVPLGVDLHGDADGV